MNKAEMSDKIIAYLNEKHERDDIDDEMELEDIGEDDEWTLMFDLCKIFGVDNRCDGDEIGKYASVWNAIDAVWECISCRSMM